MADAELFGLLLLPHLLELAALTFDLLLLLFDLTLRLLLLNFLILHRISNRVSAHTANGSADSRAGGRMANRGADQRAGASP